MTRSKTVTRHALLHDARHQGDVFRINARYPQYVRLRLTELLLDSHWHVMRETRPLAQELTYLMQFDVRFGAPRDKAGNRIERDLDEAVELVFVHFIERYIHGASEIAL